ncbi:hotdog family protein [Ulvibacter antarcticus]|uniref:3-hydroxyacyl-[acyl-carrier-protein] dehydratase n=1 Tax=Ulvibacter antarcticus TaxID=442714 RepID=A0A3L9Z0T9_9FLAO|nr:3-hydroxyacyl-ACP dehydratase [Ulvibacter antarcticus]RMA65720.1 3-hydroxyacyl-[acyl-carrier-protein] dehydratase [Ulvibacter antarcticus]
MLIEGLYTLTDFKADDEQITANIHLNKDHDIFKGHFPGNPIMPGVCMIQIIKELTEKALNKSLFLSVSSNIKFMALINPFKTPDLTILISYTEEDGMVKIKNTSSFEDTEALKLSATFKVID